MRHPIVRTALVGLVCLWTSQVVQAEDYRSLVDRSEKRVYRDASGDSLPYRLFIPAKYDRQQKYPLILFLHGAGERGDDNSRQLVHAGVLRFVSDAVAARQPCFLVAPQCPNGCRWMEVDWGKKTPPETPAEPSRPMRLTMELLESLQKEFSIDPDRLYVTGLSMGGFGSYDLAVRWSDRIAAAVPICGGGDTSRAKQIAPIAFWIVHGGADGVVSVGLSHQMVEALKAAGASPRYSEYPGVGHNSWTKAYEEPELVDWLFSQKRKAK
jgi:predicted peptidase